MLSRRAYSELGRRLGIPARQAEQISLFISENLNPFPGRAHWGDIHQGAEPRPIYQEPDIIINRLNPEPNTPLVVEVVSPYAGSLRVSPLFRQALAQAPRDKNEAWQADLDEAVLLVKCLQQRDNTLVRLMQRLAMLQRRYILEGDAAMVPLTRAQLAGELEVHESTISRAVAGKAVQLPNKKIVPLAKWFDRSLNVRTALIKYHRPGAAATQRYRDCRSPGRPGFYRRPAHSGKISFYGGHLASSASAQYRCIYSQ